jgi:putative membrane protein
MEVIFSFQVVKALHLIFMVTWFAGLFYIVRLFVYHAEASKMTEPEKSILTAQYKIMEWRLWYIITWPSMLLNLLFGISMLVKNPEFLTLPFMHVKLVLVGLLAIYHLYCHNILVKIQNNKMTFGSTGFRMLNEVATLLLIAIIFVIVLRDAFSWVYGIIGIMGVAILMMVAIKGYKKMRAKNEKDA